MHKLDVCMLPTRQEFVDWAENCMDTLGKKPSQFLDNGKSSGKNRVSVLFGSTKRFNMVLARQLQAELLEAAAEKGVELSPLIEISPKLAAE